MFVKLIFFAIYKKIYVFCILRKKWLGLVVLGRVELSTHPCEGYVITVSPQNQKMVVPRRVELQTHPCQGYVITVSPRN